MRPAKPSEYEFPVQLHARLAGEEIAFWSKPGIPDWDQPSPAIRLLAENAELTSAERVLLVNCGPGALAAWASHKVTAGTVCVLDSSYLALSLAQRTAALQSCENIQILFEASFPAALSGQFDAVLMQVPKGRRLAQRRLLEAHAALRMGGALYLAGANAGGIQPVIGDAEDVFGKSGVLNYKKGNRVTRLYKRREAPGFPDWANQPGVLPGSWLENRVEINGRALALFSLPGVFSAGELDEGTHLLLDCLPSASGRALDLGCGCGVIGIALALAGAPAVDLVDENLLAVASAARSLGANQVRGAQAFPSDAFSAIHGQHYELIATNPPFHAGQGVEYAITRAFIAQSARALERGGKFILVANRFIPYASEMRQHFSRVTRVRETGKFHVLQGEL